jgi:Fic family protein
VLKTSEIEGEQLDVKSVRSSIARRLGVDIGTLRDINELLAHGVLRKSTAGGRSTSYELNEAQAESDKQDPVVR